MNIGTISNTPSQSLPVDGQGPAVVNESNEGVFGQFLQMITTGEQLTQTETVPDMANNTAWSAILFKIFDQSPATPDLALDLLQEAPSPTGESPELAITLTELMAALQPVVNESSTSLPASLVADGETSDPTGIEKANDESTLTVLGMLAGSSLVQPVSTFVPPTPALEVALPEAGLTAAGISSASPQPVLAEAKGPEDILPVNSNRSSEPVARVAPSSTMTAPVGDTSADPPTSFSQTLADQTTRPTTISEKTSSPVTTTTSATSEPVPQSQAETLVDGLKPVLQPTSINASNASQPTNHVQAPAAPAALPLPDVPALHQIVEKVSLITRQGESEVRLQLHPESLGQVLIQLHLTNGDVSVRMLTETAQAQNLIQDHLAQLKAAFSAQGLQLNNLAVGIGSDASAFDMGRRQPNDGSSGTARSQVSTLSDEIKPSVSSGSMSKPWGEQHRIDYQV